MRGNLRNVSEKPKQSKTLPPEMAKRVAAEVEDWIAKQKARHPAATLRKIAELNDVPHGMLSQMRKGEGIGLLTLIRLHELTGKSLDDLIFGPDDAATEMERRITRAVLAELKNPGSEPPPGETVALPPAPPSRPRRRR